MTDEVSIVFVALWALGFGVGLWGTLRAPEPRLGHTSMVAIVICAFLVPSYHQLLIADCPWGPTPPKLGFGIALVVAGVAITMNLLSIARNIRTLDDLQWREALAYLREKWKEPG